MRETTKLLKSDKVADMIGISHQTLRAWRCSGKGPRFIKLGPTKQDGVGYDPNDIQTWLEDRKVASTSEATVKHAVPQI